MKLMRTCTVGCIDFLGLRSSRIVINETSNVTGSMSERGDILENSCSMPRLSPLLCLTSHSPPSCVLEDTLTCWWRYDCCVDFRGEKKTGDMFCLHETLKKQNCTRNNQGGRRRNEQLDLPAAVFLLTCLFFQVGGKGWEGDWPLPGDRSGTCEGGPQILPSYWSGKSSFSLCPCVYMRCLSLFKSSIGLNVVLLLSVNDHFKH